ncbi:hypothetical protein MLD38_006084 [Melastoma candidum]|uniref:Uncharacterized protein n=1 Tax=Melastoma candidum TaxID=119954 RepID=A0ACB9RLS8_9MYRT|nr:hypothetical protein MLD38_006084 [Melastoma candidum]
MRISYWVSWEGSSGKMWFCTGHGFKMAPVVGRILADPALTGTREGMELQHLWRDSADPRGNIKEHEDQVGHSLEQQ